MLSWIDATVLNEVICLNRVFLLLWEGRLPYWLKIVSLKFPEMEPLMQLNIAFVFWIARSPVRAVLASFISSSVIEW